MCCDCIGKLANEFSKLFRVTGVDKLLKGQTGENVSKLGLAWMRMNIVLLYWSV